MVMFKRRNDARGNRNGWNEKGKISKETVGERRNDRKKCEKEGGGRE